MGPNTENSKINMAEITRLLSERSSEIDTPDTTIRNDIVLMSGHPNLSEEQIRKIMDRIYRSLPNNGRQQRKRVVNTSVKKRKHKRNISKKSKRNNRGK